MNEFLFGVGTVLHGCHTLSVLESISDIIWVNLDGTIIGSRIFESIRARRAAHATLARSELLL